MKLSEEWNSARSYNMRVNNIGNASGPILGGTSVAFEKGVEVFDDGDFDRLTGSSGRDWFFADLAEDQITNKNGNEQLN